MTIEIAVVTQPLGGVSQVKPFLELLSEHADITVITAIETDELADFDCRYYARENTREGLVAAAAQYLDNQIRMANHVRKSDTDVVWFYGSTLYTLPILAARLAGKTVVTQPKGDVPLALYLNSDAPRAVRKGLKTSLRALNAVGYAASNRVVTYTPAMADEYGLNGKKTLTDGARHVPREFDLSVPINERPKRVGYLGRYDPDKNIETVVELAKRTDVSFHLAGHGSKAEWVKQELAGVNDCKVNGWTDDPATFLNSIQLLVLPSPPIEGLPTVILEALACGTPVLATPVSAVPDVVLEGVTGWHLRSRDPDDIVEQIQAALATDLSTISRCCRDLYERRYTYEAAVDRYDELVQEVVA